MSRRPVRPELPSLAAALILLHSGCAPVLGGGPPPTTAPGSDRESTGVLVMAHGGSSEWNARVAEAVEPLRDAVPVALAFGMANRETMGAALDSLRNRGVSRVAVVRLFISGESFLPQTQYLLGITDTAPPFFFHHGPTDVSGPPTPLDHGLTVATHGKGLVDHPAAGAILLERAQEISQDPSRESVLVLGHGMGDEAKNDNLLLAMEEAADRLRAAGFARVEAETLREDWPEARDQATHRIREFVVTNSEAGKRVLVLPLRVTGFGPYAETLSGLDYAAGSALLPHPAVTDWIRETAVSIARSQDWPTRLTSGTTATQEAGTTSRSQPDAEASAGRR